MKLLQFEIDGRRWAMLPLDCYDELREALEDASDAEAMRRAEARGGESFPSSFARRLLSSGENRVRVWREYRGMTASELARSAGVSAGRIKAMEDGTSTGSVQTLRRIADALRTSIDALIPPPSSEDRRSEAPGQPAAAM